MVQQEGLLSISSSSRIQMWNDEYTPKIFYCIIIHIEVLFPVSFSYFLSLFFNFRKNQPSYIKGFIVIQFASIQHLTLLWPFTRLLGYIIGDLAVNTQTSVA